MDALFLMISVIFNGGLWKGKKKTQSFLLGGKIGLFCEAFSYSKMERIFKENSLAEIS